MQFALTLTNAWPLDEPLVVTDGLGVVHLDSLLDDGRTLRVTYHLLGESEIEIGNDFENVSFAIGHGMGADWQEEEVLVRGVEPKVFLSSLRKILMDV